MNSDAHPVRAAFRAQADICRKMHSPLTGAIIDAAADALDEGTATGRRLLGWTGDPSGTADSLALRVAGGLHALARNGRVPALGALYRGAPGDAAAAVAEAFRREDTWLEQWLDSPPQTNEAGRSAAIIAGLLVAAEHFGLPFELLELGSSAGLVLNTPHYRFDLGGRAAGDPASALLIAPKWHGSPPPAAQVEIISRRGVDCAPILLSDPAAGERLIAYVWPDQTERLDRVERAIAIARSHPPAIEQGDAADWTEARLAEPQMAGTMRILFHTITFQYFPEDAKARVRAALEAAGAAATRDRPLGWLFLEARDDGAAYELRLKLWPGGEALHLADAHPHCTWIDWKR